jgi:hypothetical protein
MITSAWQTRHELTFVTEMITFGKGVAGGHA